MSTPEERECNGSVKLVRNASGRVQIEVKAYVGDEPADLEAARDLAKRLFDELDQQYATA